MAQAAGVRDILVPLVVHKLGHPLLDVVALAPSPPWSYDGNNHQDQLLPLPPSPRICLSRPGEVAGAMFLYRGALALLVPAGAVVAAVVAAAGVAPSDKLCRPYIRLCLSPFHPLCRSAGGRLHFLRPRPFSFRRLI